MINDLVEVDKLYTKTVREGTTIRLQVLAGVSVLNERILVNATQTLPNELDTTLRIMVDEVVNGSLGRVEIGPDGKKIAAILNRDGSARFGTNIKRQNLGLRILGCRMGSFDNTTQKTFRTIVELAVEGADAIRPIFANGSNATYTVAACNARVIANLTDALPTPFNVTLPSGGVVPVARSANQRPSYLVGDWLLLPSVPRDDGGKGALYVFDAYVSTSGSISVTGNGSSDVFTGWATRANRKWIMRANNGNCVATPASFTSTTNINQSPLIGVQYLSRGKVISVMGIADSITDGRGTIIGEGFGVPACEQASSNDISFEWANRGWAGMDAANYTHYLDDFIADTGIIPDVVVHPNATPNSLPVPITPASIISNRANTARLTIACSKYGIHQIPWTVLPTNPAVKDYNASDSYRVSYNQEWTTKYYSANVLDFSALISGPVDVDGQVTMIPETTTDQIHLNDYGNSVVAVPLAGELQRIKYF